MNKAKRKLGLVLAALPLLVLIGCNNAKKDGAAAASSGPAPAAEGKIVKLGFVTNNPSQFWKIAEAGLRKYEKEAKIQVDMKMPPNGTPEDQNQILQNLASQGYDAIAVSVIAPKDQLRVLNEVADKTNLHHLRLGRRQVQAPALHRHQQLRSRARRWASASRRSCRTVEKWPCS